MKIYTKKGDTGKTDLYGGQRVYKYDPRIEFIGTLDELCAILGAVNSQLQTLKLDTVNYEKIIESIQHELFSINACIAGNKSSCDINDKRVNILEKHIDELDEKLETLQHFILPGGSQAASKLHVARTICRRAERRLVELQEKNDINPTILAYINRLSDLLFTLARSVNKIEGKNETQWKNTL